MTSSLLISQTPEAVPLDIASLSAARRQPLPPMVATSLSEGAFIGGAGDLPQNVFALLAADGGRTWCDVYFGSSIHSPNLGWTWALIAKLAERLEPGGKIVLPFATRSSEGQALLRWAGLELLFDRARSGAARTPSLLKRGRLDRLLHPPWRRRAPQPLPVDALELPAEPIARLPPSRLAPWSVALDRFLEHLTPFTVPDAGPPDFKASEILYLFHNGACRAHGIARAVDTALSGKSGLRVLDVGAAFGLVSAFWMLLDARLSAGTAVDKEAKYIAPGRALVAAILPPDRSIEFINQPIENFAFDGGADVTAFVHALHWLTPENRTTVIDRAWEALPADGVLVMNETIRPKVPATRNYIGTAIEFAEVLGLRRLTKEVLLYSPTDCWQAPAMIEDVDPAGWTSEHVLVLRKR